MAQYILFFRGSKYSNLSSDYTQKWTLWTSKLKKSGYFINGALLIEDGKIIKNQGRMIEDFIFDFNENASAFLVIEAADMDSAILISRDCPIFELGGNITIRPIP